MKRVALGMVVMVLMLAGCSSTSAQNAPGHGTEAGMVQANATVETGAAGRLAPLPSSPNAVSSLSGDSSRQVPALPMKGDRQQTMALILKTFATMGHNSVEKQEDVYVHVVFVSRLFHFKDDVELYIEEETGMVHYRSASRSGYWDFGVNRKRYEEFRRLYMSGV